MGFERPLYLVRAGGRLLVAASLHELMELIACASAVGHEIELIHAYYPSVPMPTYPELERIAVLLAGR